jgi:histone acetyltransferase (RNA polymerase elongator complex component)
MRSSEGRARSPTDEEEVVAVITTMTASYTHDCDHGFCIVCGSVWPCSRARRGTPPLTVPVPRTDSFDY